jgi:hypothetical protein
MTTTLPVVRGATKPAGVEVAGPLHLAAQPPNRALSVHVDQQSETLFNRLSSTIALDSSR